MNVSNNEKIIKAMAFEKAILEVLKKDNPKLIANYGDYNKFDNRFQTYQQYDAVIANTLNLQCFERENIHAERIVIEIK